MNLLPVLNLNFIYIYMYSPYSTQRDRSLLYRNTMGDSSMFLAKYFSIQNHCTLNYTREYNMRIYICEIDLPCYRPRSSEIINLSTKLFDRSIHSRHSRTRCTCFYPNVFSRRRNSEKRRGRAIPGRRAPRTIMADAKELTVTRIF